MIQIKQWLAMVQVAVNSFMINDIPQLRADISQCKRLHAASVSYVEMLDRYLTPEHAARDLLSMHGRRARQIIVDEIVKAIRDADMDTAKTWDRIGQEVDALMLSQSVQPIPSDDDRRIPQPGRDVGGDSRHP